MVYVLDAVGTPILYVFVSMHANICKRMCGITTLYVKYIQILMRSLC